MVFAIDFTVSSINKCGLFVIWVGFVTCFGREYRRNDNVISSVDVSLKLSSTFTSSLGTRLTSLVANEEHMVQTPVLTPASAG